MGRKRIAGLYKRNGVWHIDKRIRGIRICESTGESELAKAKAYLTKKTEEVRQAAIYGVRPKRAFRSAATKYLNENRNKRRIADEAMHLKQLDPFIALGVVRHILNLAASEWLDENNLTWLLAAGDGCTEALSLILG